MHSPEGLAEASERVICPTPEEILQNFAQPLWIRPNLYLFIVKAPYPPLLMDFKISLCNLVISCNHNGYELATRQIANLVAGC